MMGFNPGMAGIGSMIGGIFGAGQDANAVDAATRNAIGAQRQAAKQGYNQTWLPWLPSLSAETANQQIGQGAANRMSTYNSVLSNPLVQGLPTSSYGATDSAKLQAFVHPQAVLGGYSDWALDQLISKIRMQQELDKITNFAKGNQSVLPFNLNAAQHTGDMARGIGGLADIGLMAAFL